MAVPPHHAGRQGVGSRRVQQGKIAIRAAQASVALRHRAADFIAVFFVGIEAGEGIGILAVAVGSDAQHRAGYAAAAIIYGHRRVGNAVGGVGRIANPGDGGALAGLADIAERRVQGGMLRQIHILERIAILSRRSQLVVHAGVHGIGIGSRSGKLFLRIRVHSHCIFRKIYRFPFSVYLLLKHQFVHMAGPVVHPLQGDGQVALLRLRAFCAARHAERKAHGHGAHEGRPVLHRDRRTPRRLRRLRGLG